MAKKKTSIRKDKEKTTTSRSTVELPECILAEILSRLPGKSIYRFRSVCKDWLSLISSKGPCSVKQLFENRQNISPFVLSVMNKKINCQSENSSDDESESESESKRAYHRNEINPADFSMAVFDLAGGKLVNHLKLDLPCNFSLPRIVICCRGLVCCSPVTIPLPSFDEDNYKIFVWNPCTEQKIQIELPFDKVPGNNELYFGSSCTSSTPFAIHMFGFGYISYGQNHYYKIVVWEPLVDKKLKLTMKAHIHTLKEGNDRAGGGRSSSSGWWKPKVCRPFKRPGTLSTCVDGVIYWMDVDNKCILGFDLKRDQTKIIEIPEYEHCGTNKSLIDLKGSLCLSESRKGGEIVTWTLVRRKMNSELYEGEVEEWVPGFAFQHIVPKNCFISPRISPFQVLMFVENRSERQIKKKTGGDRIEELAFRSENEIFYYDVNTRIVSKSSTNPLPPKIWSILSACAYTQTLFRLQED